MKKIILIFVCVVLLISDNSACDDVKCAAKVVGEFLKEPPELENIDIKLEVPKFQQINNVKIEDLNEILHHLSRWFEKRLNETNTMFKNVNNKTTVLVKSFDLNVNFEDGNANLNVDLIKDRKNKKQEKIVIKEQDKHITLTTTLSPEQERINKLKNKTEQIDKLITKLRTDKENQIFRLEEFDTTYYDANEDNSTDYPIIDYIEMYKDTTNEEHVYIPTEVIPVTDKAVGTEPTFTETILPHPTINPDSVCHGDPACQDFAQTVFPWIASIFVTNTNQENQFSYFCDGVLLTEKVIVTDARCMIVRNQTWDPDNLLVFLGKVNLQAFGGNEKVHKVNSIVIHPNFTIAADGIVENDLALIVLEDSVTFKNNIQSACIHQENNIEESATTAWDLNGALVPIFFNRQKGEHCYDQGDVFCATYRDDIALCPSYGGIFASRQVDRWCLTGIFYGDPANRGFCFKKDVLYTSLNNHLKWIDDTVGMFKNGIL